jgi:uncharacterized repeat protein (TIGR01451 family)
VANTGAIARGAVVVAKLPPAVAFIAAAPTAGTCERAFRDVTCTLGDLADQATARIDVAVLPRGGGVMVATATVASRTPDSYRSDDLAVGVLRIADAANLSVATSDAPDPATAGARLDYGVTVANVGPSVARRAVVTDRLPAGVRLRSASASQGTCSGSRPITCALGDIPDGGAAMVRIRVRPTVAGTLHNTARVSSAVQDPIAANDAATATTRVAG